ncbi:MAG TPA: carboxyl transferase domain-containing protein, partial [Myxococcota bacterium]|nr:carboxyl transferase domain-containing protein [Myxococcota bacterium]
MAAIETRVDPRSEEFRANEAAMRALVEDLHAQIARVAAGGPADAVAKHKKAGKLTARERLDLLLDRGAPFLELSQLAAHGLYGGDAPCASVVTGVGRIAGRACVVVVNDPTVKGGTYFPLTVKKHLRAQEIARENRLPCVYLVESGGAFLPAQDEVFPDREHFGRIFYNQATLSAAGIAQIAVVHGSSTAGGAYVPAMADENVIVRGQGRVFLGGPPLVKAATGEEIDAESLGGAEVHCRESGVTDHYAEDDAHALGIARQIVARLRAPRDVSPPAAPREPLYDPAELYGIVPASLKKPFDLRDVIARLV